MRRLIMLLSLIALGVGIAVVVHTHTAYSVCVNTVQTGTMYGVTANCEHTFWRELAGLLVLLAGGFVFLFAYLLHKRIATFRAPRGRSAAHRVTNLEARHVVRGPGLH